MFCGDWGPRECAFTDTQERIVLMLHGALPDGMSGCIERISNSRAFCVGGWVGWGGGDGAAKRKGAREGDNLNPEGGLEVSCVAFLSEGELDP